MGLKTEFSLEWAFKISQENLHINPFNDLFVRVVAKFFIKHLPGELPLTGGD